MANPDALFRDYYHDKSEFRLSVSLAISSIASRFYPDLWLSGKLSLRNERREDARILPSPAGGDKASAATRLKKIAIGSGFLLPRRTLPADRHRLYAALLRPLDELALEDLAACGQREGGHRDEIFRHVVPRQTGPVQMGE